MRMTPCFRSLPKTIRDEQGQASLDVTEPSVNSKERDTMIAVLMDETKVILDEQQRQRETIELLTTEIRDMKELLANYIKTNSFKRT
jgi:hypothetical protein